MNDWLCSGIAWLERLSYWVEHVIYRYLSEYG